LALLCILLLESIVYYDYVEPIWNAIISLITMGTIGLFVGSFKIDIKYCLKYGTIIAYICFATSLIFIYKADYELEFSMRFGYAMLPSSLWFLLVYFENKKRINLLLFIISFTSLIIWGSRGTILVVILFSVMYFIKRKKKKFIVFALLTIPLYPILQSFLLNGLLYLSDIFKSQKIAGLIKVVSGELAEASSGRDVLFHRCIELMNENPLGNGVGFWMYDDVMNGLYPHNIILQVGTEFGIIGIIILLMLILRSIIKIASLDSVWYLFAAYIFSITIGRLMVSSMYWERPEFWVYIGFFVCNTTFINKHQSNNTIALK